MLICNAKTVLLIARNYLQSQLKHEPYVDNQDSSAPTVNILAL